MNLCFRRMHICHQEHSHQNDEEVRKCQRQERKYVFQNSFVFISIVKRYKITEDFFILVSKKQLYNKNQRVSLQKFG